MPNTEKHVVDARRAALLEAQAASPFIFEGDGTTPLTSANFDFPTWWFEYLGSLGYTGDINKRELDYWLDLFEAVTGQAYNEAYGPGYS